MDLGQLRSRYLVAMGLSGSCALSLTTACRHADPEEAPVATVPVRLESDAAALADTGPREDAGRAPAETARVRRTPFPREPHAPNGSCGRTVACQEEDTEPPNAPYAAPFDRCPLTGDTGNAATFSRRDTLDARAKDPRACCYASFDCQSIIRAIPGRALRGGAGARDATDAGRIALVDSRADWNEAGLLPDCRSLTVEERDELARRWQADALVEHASIAAFARLSLQLLAVGAPPSLVAAAHEAAADEIRHARVAFAIASAYAGRAIGPGPLSAGSLDLGDATLEAVAHESFVDGCIGEGLAAAVAREAASAAIDPSVRRALEVIAADEERHAELAWRIVAWAIRRGGERVRSAVLRAANAESGVHARTLDGDGESDLRELGLLPSREVLRIRARVIGEVVLPCIRAALA